MLTTLAHELQSAPTLERSYLAEIAQRLDPRVRVVETLEQRSFAAFTRRMVPDYIGGEHIDRLTDALEAVERGDLTRLIVTMPPRHSKSIHVSENFPAWYLGRHPDQRIIAASHTAQLAYTFSRRVRNKIADPRYPFDVHVADDKGAVQAWDTDAGGGYIAVGAGGSPTGHGGNGIVIDDPIRSAADAESQTVRDGLWEWYQGTMRTRLQPGGWIILTATRWHEDDLTGRLLQESEHGGEHWHHIHMPAIDDAGDALWPEFWPLDDLDKIRHSVGSRVWEAQYQGRPSPAEGGILKHDWFQHYATPEPHYTSVIQAWDTAFKTDKDSDMSACVTVGIGAYGLDVLDVFASRLEFPDLERAVQDQHLVWSARYPGVPFVVLVEDKGSGQSLIQAARRWPHTNITIIPIAANRPNEKMQRVNEIAPIVEGRRVRVPAQAHWLDAAMHEWTAFPFAKHDDRTDAFAMAIARAAGITRHTMPATDTSAFAPVEESRRDRTRRIRRGRR